MTLVDTINEDGECFCRICRTRRIAWEAEKALTLSKERGDADAQDQGGEGPSAAKAAEGG